MRTPLKIVLAPIVALAGCLVGGDAGPEHYGTSLKAITKTKWLSCWVRPTTESVSPTFDVDTLQCSAAIGEGPLSPHLISINSQGEGTWVRNGRIDQPGTVEVGRLQRASYPHTIDVQVLPDSRGLASSPDTRQGFVMKLVFERYDQYTIDKPLVIEQPVDLWPIEVTVEGEVFAASLEQYTVPLPAGIKLSDGLATFDTLDVTSSRFGVLRRGQTKTFYVLAQRGARRPLGGLALLSKTAQDRVKFELDGPGAYIATADGLKRKPDTNGGGTGTSTHMLDSCPGTWGSDDLCDRCLAYDPACNVNSIPGCEAQWRGDAICDDCLGDDPDCEAGAECPASWRGDGTCDPCLGNDSDCVMDACHDYWINDGVCDPCLGAADMTDCTSGILCPSAWRSDGTCDECLGDDPDCENIDCPASWRGDDICDECLGDDPDCEGAACPAEWRGDGICDECLGDDPDCEVESCPMEWYGDGLCDECLINDPDCEDESCPWSWYNDGLCDECLGDDPDCL